MRKFDYLFHYDYGIWLSPELIRRGKKVCIVSFNSKQEKEINDSGIYTFNINKIRKEIKPQDKKLDSSLEYKRICKKYNYYQIRRAIFPSLFYYQWFSEEEYSDLLLSYMRAWEYVFENLIKCKYYVRMIGDDYQHYATKIVVPKYVDQCIYIGGYAVMDRIQFTNDFLSRWKIKNYKISPSKQEKEFIIDWIGKQLQSRAVKTYFGDKYEPPKLKTKYFAYILHYIYRYYKNKESEDLFINPFRIAKEKILQYCRMNIYKRYYGKFQPKQEKYIYFPLHVVNDTALTSYSEPFVHQSNIVELLHKFLPFGYKIYTKEHPAEIGCIHYTDFRRIVKLKDVVLLPPHINSHDIIEGASIVAVLSSTVGLEAIIHQKPVITFVDSYYAKQGITIDVRDLCQLPELIIKAINFRPSMEKIIQMLTRLYRDSFPVDAKLFFQNDVSVSPDFADSLIKYCEHFE